jgi:soluble lytic murein transglycosylase-like protein
MDPRIMADYIRLQMTSGMNVFNDNLFTDSTNASVEDGSGTDSDFMQTLQMMMQQQSQPVDPTTTNNNVLPFSNEMMSVNQNPVASNVLSASSLLQNLQPLQGPIGFANLQAIAALRNNFASPVVNDVQKASKRTSSKVAPPPAGADSYNALIEKASTKFGVSTSLIKAVIQAESGFNPKAVSPAGARGLMQLMPRTGAALGVTDPFDVEQNIMAGAKYLSQMLRRFNGEEAVALAAYNAGPGRVSRLGISNTEQLRDKYLLLPRETQKYVDKVLGFKQNYQS